MNMDLTISEKLRLVIKRKKLKMGEIAEKLGCSRQNLHKKFDKNTWTDESLKEVCEVMGISYEIIFTDSQTGEKY